MLSDQVNSLVNSEMVVFIMEYAKQTQPMPLGYKAKVSGGFTSRCMFDVKEVVLNDVTSRIQLPVSKLLNESPGFFIGSLSNLCPSLWFLDSAHIDRVPAEIIGMRHERTFTVVQAEVKVLEVYPPSGHSG